MNPNRVPYLHRFLIGTSCTSNSSFLPSSGNRYPSPGRLSPLWRGTRRPLLGPPHAKYAPHHTQLERDPVSVAQHRVTGTVRIAGGPAVAAAVVRFPPPPRPRLGRTARDVSTQSTGAAVNGDDVNGANSRRGWHQWWQ